MRSEAIDSAAQEQGNDSVFRAMAETLPLAIYLSVGKDQICEYINPRFVELFGYTLEEVPSAEQWWPRAYPNEDYRNHLATEWNARVQRAIETQSPIEPMETVVTCKDGSEKWIRWGFITIGEKSYAYGQDLTESKRSEKELRESEERFHTLFERAPLGYQSLDKDGRFMEVNETWLEMLGYEREEVIGKWAGDFLTPEFTAAFRERFPLFKASGKMHSEFRILHKDGTPRIIDVQGRIGHLPNGEFKQTHCILADVTEHKQAEEARQASEAQFRSTINDLLVGIVVHAPDSSILLSNPQAQKTLGLSEEQMMGKKAIDPAWRFVNEDLSPVKVADYPVNRVISTRKKMANQIIGINRPDRKNIIWALVGAVPVFTNDNELNRVVVNFLDITQRKQAEEEEIRLKDELHQAQKMETIGQLAGGVAHDFNNILQSILGHAELASALCNPDDPVQGDLQEIQKATRLASDLTRQLLAFARKQKSATQMLNLNQCVQNLFKMVRPLIGGNIDLVWNPGTDPWPVRMDPIQVDQILVNLCVNARDAIGEASGKVHISVKNTQVDAPKVSNGNEIVPGDYVVLSVSDTGCGIRKEAQEKLFEPFFTTKGVGKGTGLGLSTVYGITRQNEGYIDIKSEEGKGSTFSVYLPRDLGTDLIDDNPEPFTPIQQGSETVLLVEDDHSILEMSVRVLRQLGYTVLKAYSPEEALRLAEEHGSEINLLLTDVIMPGMNGRELADILKKRLPHLKLLFISGHEGNILAADDRPKEQIGSLLAKPFSMVELATRIRQVLDH